MLVSPLLGMAAALGCGELLALLIRRTAIDMPSLGELAQAWAPRWGVLLASVLIAISVLLPEQPPRQQLLRLPLLLLKAVVALLAISLLAGATAALLEHIGLSSGYALLPNPSRQAAAEAMLAAAHWAGLPIAVAVAVGVTISPQFPFPGSRASSSRKRAQRCSRAAKDP